MCNGTRGVPRGGAARLQPPLKTAKTEIKKNTDFVGIIISNVLGALPLNRNKPLKSAS
jgi:hypothetical protein